MGYRLLDSAVMMLAGFAGVRDTEEGSVEYQDEWMITYHKEETTS